MEYLDKLKYSLYYTLYPLFFILTCVGAILLSLGAPIVHLGNFVWHGCMWPFRFLAKFETLYIFLSVSLLVGLATGTTLYYTSSFLVALMKLESQPQEPLRGRTMASYRAGRSEKLPRKAMEQPPHRVTASPRLVNTTSAEDFAKLLEREKQSGRKSLLTSTILEEDDTSDNGI